ncbi:hypothetical protein P4C99_19930, partial [Pontiellaceae bacterium B1224]|nr:hypothetical protein [Pontiellaceae bacterium B1224]
MRISVAAVLIGLFAYGAKKVGEYKRARNALTNIQGTWKCTYLKNGTEAPEVAKGYILRFRGNTVERIMLGGYEIGEFEVDTNVVPAQLFFWWPLGDGYYGKRGIMDIKGNHMKLCRSLSPGTPAPEKFKSIERSHSL